MRLTESVLKQIIKEELRKVLKEAETPQQGQAAAPQSKIYLNKYDIINPAEYSHRKGLRKWIIDNIPAQRYQELYNRIYPIYEKMNDLLNKPIIENGKENPEWEKAVGATQFADKQRIQSLDEVIGGELFKFLRKFNQPVDGLYAQATAIYLMMAGLTSSDQNGKRLYEV